MATMMYRKQPSLVSECLRVLNSYKMPSLIFWRREAVMKRFVSMDHHQQYFIVTHRKGLTSHTKLV